MKVELQFKNEGYRGDYCICLMNDSDNKALYEIMEEAELERWRMKEWQQHWIRNGERKKKAFMRS